MRQSSIEWLVSHFNEYGIDYGLLQPIIQKAKEMHKQEVIDARVNGMAEGIGIGGNPINYNLHETHEQYYNETYNIKR